MQQMIFIADFIESPTPYTPQNRAVKQQPANRTHNFQLHIIPTTNLKTKGMYSLLLTHTPVLSFRIHTNNTHPTNGIPKPQTQTN